MYQAKEKDNPENVICGVHGHPSAHVSIPSTRKFLCIVLVIWRRRLSVCQQDAASKIPENTYCLALQ
jgi:hypothetical protein